VLRPLRLWLLLRRNAVFIAVAACYVYSFPYFERLNNPNENVRIWMTRAIVEHGELNLGRVTAEWGWVNDKAVSGTREYSGKAPGTSFLGVPVLFVQTKLWHLAGWPSPSKKAATLALRLFAVALPLVLFLRLFGARVERITGSRKIRDLLTLGLGVGTLIYPYGVLYVGHALGAALAFCSFLLLHPDRSAAAELPGAAWPAAGSPSPGAAAAARGGVLRIAAAGWVAGWAVFFEYQILIVAMLLGGYALVRHRTRGLAFALGAVPPAIALGAYHAVMFGRPWEFPYGHLDAFGAHHRSGFFGVGVPDGRALVSALFAPSYGMFAFSPFLLLGIAGAIVLSARRATAAYGVLILLVTATMFLLVAGMTNWRAGWTVGPRYAAVVVPFLALAIAHLWVAVAAAPARIRSVVGVLNVGLVGAAVFLNGISGVLYPHYPEVFDNPVFDLALPLLREGRAPYNLGRLAGLPGSWSLLPLALVVAVALLHLAKAVGGGRRRIVRSGLTLAALGTAAVYLTVISHTGRPTPAERHAADVVRSTWEPTLVGQHGR
jgi:hypothetical protein